MVPGDYLLSKSGLTVYLIASVTRLHTSGEPVATDRLRVVCSKVATRKDGAPVPTPPTGHAVHPWAEAPLVASRAKPVVVALVPPTSEQATAIRAKLRDRRQHARIETVERVKEWKNAQPLDIRTRAVMSHDGKQLRPPTIDKGAWRDPDDVRPNASHRPREIVGWRSHDPLVTLAKRNSNITEQMIHAADCYRLAYEMGPGGARPGYEPPLLRNYQFGPSSGPGDARIAGEMAWQRVQHYIRDPRQLVLLDHVVIRCQVVTSWARKWNWDPKAAVGYLIAALETLLSYYDHEVATLMRGDDLQADRERKSAAR